MTKWQVYSCSVIYVPRYYQADGRKSSLSIPGVADAQIKQLDGHGGGPITIEGHPLCIAPGKAATVARSSAFSLSDHGWSWQFSGRSGLRFDFTYQSDGRHGRIVGVVLLAAGLWIAVGAGLAA